MSLTIVLVNIFNKADTKMTRMAVRHSGDLFAQHIMLASILLSIVAICHSGELLLLSAILTILYSRGHHYPTLAVNFFCMCCCCYLPL
jgi:hypothetical protein